LRKESRLKRIFVRINIKDVQERSAEENIWTEEGIETIT
jgi:hypothetical protein